MANGNASFRGLSALSGYSTSKVYGISGDGRVAVGSSYTDNDTAQACIWTAQNVVGLGTLQDYPYGEAYAASKDGSVVGGTCNLKDLYLAFMWTQAGGIKKVPSSNPNF
ncbi:MAG TPA: PEP-CTERM sorting domain-containing protein, partial [Blastocatellia bacterium]|nr:PEP-CTERM sorting domain-containing protein [Blastocatellia bacterium]